MSKNYLKDETVLVKFIPNTRNGVLDTKHPLYGGLSSNASIAIPAPVLRGRIKEIFEPAELKFLEKELKRELTPHSDFWREYAKDDLGIPQGPFPIFLKKEGMMLNTKDPIDYIKLRVLEDSPIVAPSPKRIKDRPAEYRFVLIKSGQLHAEDLDSITWEKKASKLHTKYEEDIDVLKYVLRSFNKNVSNNSKLPFVQKETWKLVKSSSKEFTATLEDEFLEEKVLLHELVRYKLVNVSNKLYYELDGSPLRLDGEVHDFDGAARLLGSGIGQEKRIAFELELKTRQK